MKKELSMDSVQILPIGEIKPYEKNIKKHSQEQIELLANNIKEVGYTQPIVVDKDNVIIAGHGRYEAMKLLGIEKIAVVKLDKITPEQARAQRILDNKLNESPYDFGNLQFEIKELHADGFNLNAMGFDNIELANFGIGLDLFAKQNTGGNVGDNDEEDDGSNIGGMQLPQLPQNIMGTQAGKKPITFFCTDEQYQILQPIFATSKKWEANTDLLIEMVTSK